MSCPECDDLFQRRLDGPGPADREALELHLAVCASCRDRHLLAQLLEDGLRALPRPTPPAGLSGRIVAGVLADRRQRLRWRARAGAVAAAACLLLTPLAVYFLGRLAPEAPRAVVRNTAPEQPARRPAPPLRRSVEEAGSAVASLTDRFADQTRAQARLLWSAAAPRELPRVGPLPGVTDLQAPLDPAAASLRQAGHGVGAGFEVVAGSARRAVWYFVQEIPAFDLGNRTTE